jgi:hypothetical protein
MALYLTEEFKDALSDTEEYGDDYSGPDLLKLTSGLLRLISSLLVDVADIVDIAYPGDDECEDDAECEGDECEDDDYYIMTEEQASAASEDDTDNVLNEFLKIIGAIR